MFNQEKLQTRLDKLIMDRREQIGSTDCMKVAEQLYRHANPKGSMDTPNSAYETTRTWFKEWAMVDTQMEFYDWCIQEKHGPQPPIQKQLILDIVSDIVGDFIYYDRKNCETLSADQLKEALNTGIITLDEIADHFREVLIKSVTS